MNIIINGERQSFESSNLSIAEVIRIRKVESPDMVSVQLNGAYIEKERFIDTYLKENDIIDILYFMGGGDFKIKGFMTKAIHGPNKNNDAHKALRTPIYDCAAFEFENAEDIENAFLGKKSAHSYSRISNPTVAEFEQKINFLAGGFGSIALSSGMAAIANTILALAQTNDTILTSKYIFGNTYSLMENTLKPWGLKVKYADFHKPEEVERSIDETTRAIFIETITNPQLAVFDIEALGRTAEKHGILLIADNTASTPYLFHSKDYGVNIDVISSTKYMSGGATSVGGIIIDYGNFNWSKIEKLQNDYKKFGQSTFLMKLRREVYRNLGACMSAQNAYLHTLGLETIALRMDRSSQNAMDLALYLHNHPEVKRVNYPGLERSPYHAYAKKFFNGQFGGILTFELESKEKCFRFMNNLKIIRRATNINDNKSLIIHPSSTIYCEFPPETKKELGVPENMLRLSAGIEDREDLIEDIEDAFKTL